MENSRIMEMEMKKKQTAATAHVGVYSRERADESPAAITLDRFSPCNFLIRIIIYSRGAENFYSHIYNVKYECSIFLFLSTESIYIHVQTWQQYKLMHFFLTLWEQISQKQRIGNVVLEFLLFFLIFTLGSFISLGNQF